MAEVPQQVGKSGIKLIGIDQIENGQLVDVINEVEAYSRSLVNNFENTTKQIKERLDNGGSVALLSMQKLMESRDAFDSMVNQNYSELESIMSEVETVVDSMKCLDELQAQVNELYDTIVTVEQFVRNPV